jgi:hypothetical protein
MAGWEQDMAEFIDRVEADAPELQGVLGPRLRRRIARTRTARLIGTRLLAGAGAVGLVVGLVLITSNDGAPVTDRPASGTDQSGDHPAASSTLTPAGCGAKIDIPPTDDPLRLTAAEPVRLSPDEHGLAQVKMTLVNASDRRIEGISAASPSTLLSRDGIVVTTSADIPGSGQIINLTPGQRQEFTATISMAACTASTGTSQALEPGEYTVHAMLGFQFRNTNGTEVGESINISGGSWTAILN